MGGSAFRNEQFTKPTQAHRMTTLQYEAFIEFCLPRLGQIFPRVMPLESFRSKETHGDLDLRCASDDVPESGTLKGREMGGEGFEYQRNKDVDLRELCERVASSLQAIRWLRNGREISCAVPTRVVFPELQLSPLGEMEASLPQQLVLVYILTAQPFYQVDCCLVPPDSLDFSVFIGSYSGVNAVLGPSLGLVSRSLTLTQTSLALAHRAFKKQPRIIIPLVNHPDEFCRWAGLDYGRWLKGFDRIEDMFLWLTSPPGHDSESYQKQSSTKEEKRANNARHLALTKQQSPAEVQSSHVPVLLRSWRVLGSESSSTRRPGRGTAPDDTPFEQLKRWLRKPGGRWCAPRPVAASLQTATKATETPTSAQQEEAPDRPPATEIPVTRGEVLVEEPPLPHDLDLGALRALKYFDKMDRYEALLDEAVLAAQEAFRRQMEKPAEEGSPASGGGELATDNTEPPNMSSQEPIDQAGSAKA